MRHGKSAWDTDAPDDHARPLSDRGHREAPLVAARLLELGWRPERVVSSDSERTRQTYAHLRQVFGDPLPVEFTRELYLPDVDAVRGAVERLSPEAQVVLLLGHNPGFEEALAWLTGADERLKTSSAALLEADTDSWGAAAAGPRAFRLVTVIRAKALRRPDPEEASG